MATWYSRELGDGIDALGPSGKIQNAYMLLCATQKQPPDFAIFSRYDLRANIVTIYFSPSAEMLAKGFQAMRCDKPQNIEGFGMLCGDARAWEILFPNGKVRS